MATINDAVKEIVDELRNVSDIRKVFDAPPEGSDFKTFAITYAKSGVFQKQTAGFLIGLHNVHISFFVHNIDLTRAYVELMGIYDQIPKQLEIGKEARRFSAAETWTNITYEISNIIFGGVEYVLVDFTIHDVKVQVDIS